MSKKYYSKIDNLPLQNWINANEGDLTACRIGTDGTDAEDAHAWEIIYNDFINKVGLGEDHAELIELMMQRAKMQIEYLETRKRNLINAINAVTGRISSLIEQSKSTNKVTITAILNVLSKAQGYQLKISDLTTLAYFELLKQHNNG